MYLALRTAQAEKFTKRHKSHCYSTKRFTRMVTVVFLYLGITISFCNPSLAQYNPNMTGQYGNPNSSQTAFPKPKDGMFGKFQKIEGSLPLHLQADEMIYDNKGNKVIARGNVEVQYEGNNLTADQIIYDQSANTLMASGNVVLNDVNGNIVRAENYTLTDDFRDGFVQSLSIVAKDDTRISAEQASRKDGNVTQFSNAKFTPCRSDGTKPPLWCVSALKVTRDEAAGVIKYNDAQFEMFGKSIFYLPYFEHPDPTVKRKSGFLAPNYGTDRNFGTFVEIPYYFALSPSYDFIFHPRYMSKDGILWMGDWRQKLSNGQYSLKLAGMDQNANDLPTITGFTQSDRDALNGFRGSLKTIGNFSINNWWKYGWDVTQDTDDSFRRFYKLDYYLATQRVNNIYLTGLSERNYLGINFYQLQSLVYNTPASTTYTYPIIDYNYIFDNPVLGGELKFVSNSMSFKQPDGPAGYPGAETTRAIAEVKWRRQLTDKIGISYTPFAELRGDVYAYNNYINPNTGQFVSSDSLARGLATGGLTVSYPWVASTKGSSHIIEPIGQIIARQSSVQQSAFPDQDAISIVFDDTNLFETSKFSGYDRLETGTRANVGLQYTFQHKTGGYARAVFGQSYQLAGVNAYANNNITCYYTSPSTQVYAPGINYNCSPIFSPRSGLETTNSDYVLGLYLAPSPAFRLISQSRFNDSNFEFRREDLALNAFYGPLTVTSSYSYRYDDPEINPNGGLQDIAGYLGLRLTDRWSVNGGFRYDITNSNWRSDSVQLRYLDECFMLSATYLNTNITDPSGGIKPDQSIMFRVEYKYLGGFNYKTNAINQISGADTVHANP